MNNEIQDNVIAELVTIEDLLRWAMTEMNHAEVFYGHGNASALDEAVALMLAVIQIEHHQLDMFKQARLTTQEKAQFVELLTQRIEQRVPAAYLTGQAWFAGLPFMVNENVLVPRSPFAELIAKNFAPYTEQKPQHILDLCTGSGCIAIACAYQYPEAQVDAVDISIEALEVAEQNIHQHSLEHRVFPLQSDGFENLQGQQYDLIVTNPPYVDAEDMASLPAEFHHEPELGLASGEDGLDLTRHILANAAKHLTDNGWLFVEVGNSMVHMGNAFPHIDFEWVQLDNGGHGIFAISKAELVRHFQ